ncbi:MAG: hypothetical protein RR370_03700 [Synergistaceae bacterium]
MWKIKKEYHFYPNCYAPQDRYINSGDLASPENGEKVSQDYYLNLWRYRCITHCNKPTCPHLVFATKGEALKAMGNIPSWGSCEDGTYCLSGGEYFHPTLSVKFHHSWTLENN